MSFAVGVICRRRSIRSASTCRPSPFPSHCLKAKTMPLPKRAAIYCGTIGIEFMHIANAEKREWLERPDGADHRCPNDRQRRPEARPYASSSRPRSSSRSCAVSLSRHQALLARRPHRTHPVPRSHVLEVSASLGVTKAVDCDEPSRPPERDDQHLRPRRRRHLHQVRRRRPALHHGRRRREVPHGRHRRLHRRPNRRKIAPAPRLEPQPPRGRRPCRQRPRPRQAEYATPSDETTGLSGQLQVLPIIIHGDAAFAGQGICR